MNKHNKDTFCFMILLFLFFLLVGVGSGSADFKTGAKENKINFEAYKEKYMKFQYESKQKTVIDEDVIEEESIELRPHIDNIPLSDEILDYTYEIATAYDLPYTLLLAIMKVESDFIENTISKTNDYGIAQINKKNIKWMSEEAGINDVDPLNPEHSIEMAAWYLDYLKEYWGGYDISEEDKFFLVVLSYNRGVNGSKQWVENNGWNNKYVDKVLNNKIKYEERMYSND